MMIKEPRRSAFLVSGMHRSGTSAFAGTLSCLGLSVPADLMAANPANPNGYYESGKLASLHNWALREAGSRWDDWSPIAPAWFNEPAAHKHVSEIVRFLDSHFAHAGSFVVKDPRICRLMPLWRRALTSIDARIHVVIPLRHPGPVARSLRARDGLLAGESHLLWLRHLLDAEATTRDLPRVFVPYDALLADWRSAVHAMAVRLQYRWPRLAEQAAPDINQFLDPKLCHHQSANRDPGEGDRRADLAQRGWELFSRLASRPEPAITAELDSLRAELDRIPCAHRLPLGIGTAAGHLVHMISRLGSRLATGQRLR
jgi:hypothetical protein